MSGRLSTKDRKLFWERIHSFLEAKKWSTDFEPSCKTFVSALDNELFNEKLPRTVIGVTVEKWLEKEQNAHQQQKPHLQKSQFMYELVKMLIGRGADFVRSLKVESKGSREENLTFMLRLVVFGNNDSVWISQSDEKKFEDFPAEAAKNTRFINAVCDLYKYNVMKKIQKLELKSAVAFDKLKKKDREMELANPYVRCLICLLQLSNYETDAVFVGESPLLESDDGQSDKWQFEMVNLTIKEESISKFESNSTDVILKALEFACDLRDRDKCLSYLQPEYQNFSEQAEEFAVALIDEVKDMQELDLIMKMEDRWNIKEPRDVMLWTGKKMNKITLIQHAIKLKCKTFVVSKKCQYVMENIVFGRLSQYWNSGRATNIGLGMPTVLLVALKMVIGVFVGVGIFAGVPLFLVFKFISWLRDCKCECRGKYERRKKKRKTTSEEDLLDQSKAEVGASNTADEGSAWARTEEFESEESFFCDIFELPCQRYLFDFWWYSLFLVLIFLTAFEEDFDNNDDLNWGLTYADIMVLVYATHHLLRSFLRISHRVSIVLREPKMLWKYHFVFPGAISFVDFSCCLLIVVAFSIWIGTWKVKGAWLPGDVTFLNVDLTYTVASLLAFSRLAHFYKAQQDIGKLVLSMNIMLIRDVIVFAIILVTLLFLPYAIALRKMYSYYKVAKSATGNITQPFSKFETTAGLLFWTMLGMDERKSLEVPDQGHQDVRDLGAALIGAFVVVTTVVAMNMLIAMMNQTYEEIVKNVDKEYVFNRSRMWLEYISDDYFVLPPPLNALDFIKLCWNLYRICTLEKYHNSQCTCCWKKEDDKDRIKRHERKLFQRFMLQKVLVVRYLWRSMDLEIDDEITDIDGSPQNLSSGSKLRDRDTASC